MEALAHPVFSQLGVLAAAHLLEIGDDFLGRRGERTREPDREMGERWYGENRAKREFLFPAKADACIKRTRTNKQESWGG